MRANERTLTPPVDVIMHTCSPPTASVVWIAIARSGASAAAIKMVMTPAVVCPTFLAPLAFDAFPRPEYLDMRTIVYWP